GVAGLLDRCQTLLGAQARDVVEVDLAATVEYAVARIDAGGAGAQVFALDIAGGLHGAAIGHLLLGDRQHMEVVLEIAADLAAALDALLRLAYLAVGGELPAIAVPEAARLALLHIVLGLLQLTRLVESVLVHAVLE